MLHLITPPLNINGVPVLLILGLALVFLAWHRLRHPSRFPPGPRGFPIIGAALSMPKVREWVTYAQWKAKYGPIVGVNVFGQRVVLVNSPEMAHELLDNRSAIYSDRPPFPMLEMMGFGQWNMGVMPDGHILRLSRRLLLQYLSPRGTVQCRKIQQHEVLLLLEGLLKSPTDFFWHVRSANVGQIMHVFYGHRVNRNGDDSLVKLNDDMMSASSRAGSPAAYFVNTFPILKYWPAWLPGGSFKHEAEIGRLLAQDVYNLPSKVFEENMAKGNPVESFIATHFDSSNSPDHKDAARAVAATSYGAGIETSTSTMLTFILAMVLNPKAQRRAQAEIDQAISGRLPTLEDRDANRLPFVNAILTECYRWAPPGNFGLPHRLTTEDSIQGYTLPKGTVVMSDIWSILHDENVYSRPMEFLPERFLDDKAEDPRKHVYGYGRRICPGRNLAEGMLWLGMASILATFDISPEIDGAGHAIIPLVKYTSGVMSHPEDFQCRIKPRSSAAVELILQELAPE